MKILCVGDVVSRPGREMLQNHLERLIKEYDISLTLINGENLSHGRGISRNTYDEMIGLGVGGITLGNHTWNCKDVVNLLSYNKNIIRPANFPRSCPGKGSMLLPVSNGEKVGVINIIGRTYMESADCPFEAVEREISKLKNETNIIKRRISK